MQQHQENLLDLLDDIESGIEDAQHLFDFKDFIKDSLVEGAKLVKEITNGSKENPDYYVFTDAVDQISNNLVRIYNIDNAIFGEILTYSGFMQEQVSALSSGIAYSENRLEEMSTLLVESFYKEIDILQNSNSKKIMARTNYQDKSDNLFSDFIEYVLEDVLPAQAMENLAKISAFQRTRLKSVLERDPIFSAIFEKYRDGNELTTVEKRHVRNTLEHEIKEMLTKAPVYKSQNGIEYSILQNDNDIRVWDKTSGRNRPDASGVDENGVLYAYTVTSNINLDNQNNQAIEWANRIFNGIKIGKLAINDFKIITCCNPVLNDLDEKGVLFKSFKKEVNDLEKIHIINQNELNSLKRLAIDLELLSIFRNISIDKYNELKEHLEFNVLGERFCITPKESKEQYNESLENLNLVLNCMNKIIDNNPNLDKISTPIKLIMEGISKGVYNGINSPLNENTELSSTIKKSFTSLRRKLVETMHVSFKTLYYGIDDPEEISFTANILNKKYNEEKNIVNNWKEHTILEQNNGMSDKDFKDFKKSGHNCNFDLSGSASSQLSQIMKLSYNNGKINETLMNDSLSFVAYKLTTNNYNGKTLKSLVTGINNALESDLPYDLKKACKSFVKYNIVPLVVNELKGSNQMIIANEIKNIIDRKINRKNKI